MMWYKFRAEASYDYNRFKTLFFIFEENTTEKYFREYYAPYTFLDDVSANVYGFQSDFSLDDLRFIMSLVPDGHRMIQTLDTEESYDKRRQTEWDKNNKFSYYDPFDMYSYPKTYNLSEEFLDSIIKNMSNLMDLDNLDSRFEFKEKLLLSDTRVADVYPELFI